MTDGIDFGLHMAELHHNDQGSIEGLSDLCCHSWDNVVEQGGLQDGGVEELVHGVAQVLGQLCERIVGGGKHGRHQVGVIQGSCAQ